MAAIRERPFLVDEAFGQIIRLVGHDLRNKLSVMQNSTYFLNMKVGGQNEKLAKHLGILLREINQSNRIVLNLMDLAAPKTPKPALVELNPLIQQTLEQVPPPEGAILKTMLAAELPPVQLDGEQLGRALENILLFQYAALRPGDTLRVISRAAGAKVYVELVDSGPGLAKEQVARLFELQPGEGPIALQMGLVVARQLIALNKGQLEVESRLGLGTRFSIILPLSPAG
jgi:signal transduction histidine kinase